MSTGTVRGSTYVPNRYLYRYPNNGFATSDGVKIRVAIRFFFLTILTSVLVLEHTVTKFMLAILVGCKLYMCCVYYFTNFAQKYFVPRACWL